GTIRAPAVRGFERFWPGARASRFLFRDGRSSHQLERFAGIRPRGEPLYLWARGVCVLAGRSFRLAVDNGHHGSKDEMTEIHVVNRIGGHTDRSTAPTCYPRAGRRARF